MVAIHATDSTIWKENGPFFVKLEKNAFDHSVAEALIADP